MSEKGEGKARRTWRNELKGLVDLERIGDDARLKVMQVF